MTDESARRPRSPRRGGLLSLLDPFVHGRVTPPPPVRAPLPKQPRTDYGIRELVRVRPRASSMSEQRINLIVPAVAVASTFGGVQTALELFRAASHGADRRRIISVEPLDASAIAAFPEYQAVLADDDPDDACQLVSIASPEPGTLPVGPNDTFIATFWPTAAFVLDVRRWQASTYGRAPDRFAYLIQDFEPAFYSFSAQSMLARATYDEGPSTIAIFNTALLQGHFHDMDIRFPVEFVFEPRLSPELRQFAGQPTATRARRILVYGRPGKPRNAFALIVDGLRAWRASYPDAERWSVVSAGEAHPDIDLGGGMAMHSLGKLDLPSYADQLRGSAIGMSMMVSPHPSYPPLEMAQLGLLVLTNRYGHKDLSAWHTNITSLGAPSVDSVAGDLAELCQRFESDPTVGDRGRLLREDYLGDGPQFPFADELAALLREP